MELKVSGSKLTMKILFLARSTLFFQPGGDTLQIQQTAKFLEKLGCRIDIRLSGDEIQPEQYDIIHFFNLIRPADARLIVKSNKPLVISSIYHDYSEYDSKFRKGIARMMILFFGKFGFEYFKTIGRWINGSDIFPGRNYLAKGHLKSMKALLKRANFVLATSNQELQLIHEELGFLPPSQKISLGTEHVPEGEDSVNRAGVLCAARIEGLKNQLNLIRALQGEDINLTLTGQAAANQQAYYKLCQKEADETVRFTGLISRSDLEKEFYKAKVHALPSYYETTGLATLEALKMGCQVVITHRGAQAEIYGDKAFYCDPEDIISIRKAVKRALATPGTHVEWVKENFSWQKAAADILDIYQKLIRPGKS